MADFSNVPTEQLLQLVMGSQARQPDAIERSAMTPEVPSAAVRLGRGMMDVYQGAKQKYLNHTDPEAARQYTKDVNDEIAAYEKGRGKDAGVDLLRIGGSVATPLALIPGGGQSSLARLALGAASGGTSGYTMFNPKNTETSNALSAGLGTVTGGLSNMIAPYVVNQVVKGVQTVGNKVVDAVRGAVQTVSPNIQNQITNEIKITLSKQGVDWDGLSQGMQQSLLNDAKEQLKASGRLNAEQLLRKADIESIAGKGAGTRGQITADPAQWTLERNLQKTEMNLPAVQQGQIPSITNRLQSQDVAMRQYGGNIAETVHGGTPASQRPITPLQASERAIKAIQQQDEAAGKVVDDLYKAYRETGGATAQVPDVKLADTLGRVADEIGTENIPGPVLSRLKEFGLLNGDRTKLLTVNEADKLNKLINNNNPGHGPAELALGRIKSTLNESLMDIPEQGASKALLEARRAAAEIFSANRAAKGIEQAIKDVAPDRFFENNVLGGTVRDLTAISNRLQSSPEGAQAWNALRAQSWQWAMDKATQGGRAPFSGARLDNALKAVGADRLKVLFSPSELAQIETLRRGSMAMTFEPAFSAPNRSNTTPMLIGELMRLGNRVPFLNVITKPIQEEMQQSATQKLITQALDGRGVNSAARDASQAASRSRLSDMLIGNRAAYPALVPPALLQQER